MAYKLVEYRGEPRLKTSSKKVTLPGRKQVFRARNAAGGFYADLIGLFEESPDALEREFRPTPRSVQPMLERVFVDGHRVGVRPPLSETRERFLEAFARLESSLQGYRPSRRLPGASQRRAQRASDQRKASRRPPLVPNDFVLMPAGSAAYGLMTAQTEWRLIYRDPVAPCSHVPARPPRILREFRCC